MAMLKNQRVLDLHFYWCLVGWDEPLMGTYEAGLKNPRGVMVLIMGINGISGYPYKSYWCLVGNGWERGNGMITSGY